MTRLSPLIGVLMISTCSAPATSRGGDAKWPEGPHRIHRIKFGPSFKRISEPIHDVEFSPDGRWLGVTRRNLVEVYEARKGRRVAILKHAPGKVQDSVRQVEFVADGARLASMSVFSGLGGSIVAACHRTGGCRENVAASGLAW